MSSQLQVLGNNFNSLLTEYTDTYKNYINTINSKTLTTVPEYSFVGENNIITLNGSSLNDCQANCSTNTSCSGATFNNNSNICTLSSGNGSIISNHESTAIVHEALYNSYKLQKLNSQLIDINQQILNIHNNSYDDFNKTQKLTQQQEQTLNNNYKTLTTERLHIDEMVRQFETLNSAYENGNINVTSNYYNYIILLLIVIFLLFLLIRFSIPYEQRGGRFINLSKLFFSKKF
jgi:hypothetical protein